MHRSVALRLNALNAGFYRQEAGSFSATRQGFWPGWDRCLRDAAFVLIPGRGDGLDASVGVDGPACRGVGGDKRKGAETSGTSATPSVPRVLDVACGNLRFARFLARELEPGGAVEYLAVDNNVQLARGFVAPEEWSLRFEEKDLVVGLLPAGSEEDDASPRSRSRVLEERAREGAGPEERGTFGGGGSNAPADLTVCFGFLHHVPTFEARRRLLVELLAATRPGGVCCVSFWRFMSDPGLAARARESTDRGLLDLGIARADLDEGDFLLGWQNRPGLYRYCHSFDDDEVGRLLAAAGGRVRQLDRFRSDGRSGALNEYLVLQR